MVETEAAVYEMTVVRPDLRLLEVASSHPALHKPITGQFQRQPGAELRRSNLGLDRQGTLPRISIPQWQPHLDADSQHQGAGCYVAFHRLLTAQDSRRVPKALNH